EVLARAALFVNRGRKALPRRLVGADRFSPRVRLIPELAANEQADRVGSRPRGSFSARMLLAVGPQRCVPFQRGVIRRPGFSASLVEGLALLPGRVDGLTDLGDRGCCRSCVWLWCLGPRRLAGPQECAHEDGSEEEPLDHFSSLQRAILRGLDD